MNDIYLIIVSIEDFMSIQTLQKPKLTRITMTGHKLFGAISILSGAYHGFMDGQGNPLPKEGLEGLLTWGPAVGKAATEGVAVPLARIANPHQKVPRRYLALEAGINSTVGFSTATVQTLVGYGIGYMVGAQLR